MMGHFQHEPVMPAQTHVGYVEGYLDALEKVRTFRDRGLGIEDICFALETSMKTVIVHGNDVHIPTDLHCFPSTAKLLRKMP